MSDKEQVKNTDSGFDSDQRREIEAGRESGVDVSLYAKKEFMAIQMRQIRQGLEEGLDVSVYAKLEYDWFQMEEIRKGLKKGIDIDRYASPDIPYDKMRQIRKGLHQGIDLSRFVKMDAKVLRELRKAFVSKVNIVEYVQKGYIAEQLEEIRIALEKGLDISPYLEKEFRGVAIREICKGLEHNIDVSVYAKIEYSWQQMREIRLGLENRLDVGQYINSMYSWSQMHEIRQGLEMGLDVLEYRSLMYTANDMKRIRLRLLEELAKGIAEGRKAPVRYKDFSISVSNDELEAYIEIKSSEDKEYSREQVCTVLQKEGIISGILMDEIDRILSEKCYNRPVLIARGTPAQKGADGWYEYFFNTKVDRKPKLLPDGSVDYQSAAWFELVEEGQKLAYYHEAEAGKPGVTVTGKSLKAAKGKEQKVLSGKGILLLMDKKTYVAAVSGKIELKGNHLEVSRACVLEEVTQATGNVNFDGCIYIKGDVGRGTFVSATEDIVVDGAVEASYIQCGGNLLVRQGANGMGEGVIKAEKNVEGKYFEAVKVIAGKDIHANYCLNCDLQADSKIIISGNKGVLAGGTAQAVKGMQVYHVGNRVQIATTIRLGITEKMLQEQRDLDEKIEVVHKELSILGNAFLQFQRKYTPEVRNSMEIYLKIENAIYTKELQQEKLYKRKIDLEEDIKEIEGAKAVIQGKLYEGSVIEIDRLRWIATEARNVTVKRIGNRISVYGN